MQEQKKKRLPTKLTLMIRLMVGGYVLYTAYSLIDAFTSHSGREQLFFGAFILLFTVCGSLLTIQSAYGLIKKNYTEGSTEEAEEEDKLEEEKTE